MNDLGVGENLGPVVDRAGGHAFSLAGGKKIGLGPVPGGSGQAFGHGGAVGDAVGIGGEFRGRHHAGKTQQGAKPAVLGIIAGGQDDPAIGAVEDRIRGQVRMGIAHFARRGAGGEIVHRLIGHDRGGNIE